MVVEAKIRYTENLLKEKKMFKEWVSFRHTLFIITTILTWGFTCVAFATNNFYIEEFDGTGVPTTEGYWYLNAVENPSQDWSSVVPGDGYAHLDVLSTAVDNSKGYQAIGWGRVGEGYSIEIRAAGLVVPGYVGHLFTYISNGDGTFDEIDIELSADDTTFAGIHSYDQQTDARYNAWNNANESTGSPIIETCSQPLGDAYGGGGNLVSHYGAGKYGDALFHTYTIDWYTWGIDFYVDGVYQHEIWYGEGNGPDAPAEVIIGFRDLNFGGLNDNNPPHIAWTGTKTALIDYLRVGENGLINTRATTSDEFKILGYESVTNVYKPSCISNFKVNDNMELGITNLVVGMSYNVELVNQLGTNEWKDVSSFTSISSTTNWTINSTNNQSYFRVITHEDN